MSDKRRIFSARRISYSAGLCRSNVTVRASFDDGLTYPVSRLIDRERGGYVEVTVDNVAGIIYLLYEDKFGTTDHLVRFDYEWLCENQ